MNDTASNQVSGGSFKLHDEEVARLREENRMLRQKLDEQYDAHVNAVRLNFAVQSLSDLPVLFLDSKLRITSHTNDFIHLTRRINALTEGNQSIRKLLPKDDYNKFVSYLNRMTELDKLDYGSPDPWRLAYQGPSVDDMEGGFWQPTTNLKSCHWECIGQGKAAAIVHRAHTKDRLDCYLMSRDEFGLKDEDVRLCCKLKTPSDPAHIQDLSVVLNGTAAGKNQLCDISGYTIINGSYENTLAGVQRRTAYMLTHRESLETDTQYSLEVERVGGRISRRLKNLNTGEELAQLSVIDHKAVYDETGHVGFSTFSAGIEISEIEIHTRPSRFRIEQFRIFMDDEVGIVDPDQDMAGRTFKLRIGRSVSSGRTTYMVMFEETTERRKAEREIKKQLAFIRNLIESIPQPVFYKDTNGVYLGCNQAFCEFAELPEERIVGKTVLEIAPSDEADSYYENDMKLLGNPGTIAYGIVTKTSRGEPIDVIMHKATFTLPDGTVGGIIGTVEDITERKNAERALQKSEELYRTLFENINSGVSIYKAVDDGEDFEFLDFNRAAERITGASGKDVLGGKVSGKIPNSRENGLLDAFRRVWHTGKPEYIEARETQVIGKRVWVESYVSTLPGGELVSIFDDVTELRQTLDELETSREHYRDLFNNAAVGIARTTIEDGTVIAANKVAANLYNYDTVEEFLSEFKASQAYANPDRRRELLELLKSNGRVDNFPIEIFKRGGDRLWIELSTRYYPEQGYLESVMMDISERREWEQKIKRLNAELEERVRQRTYQLEQVNRELESFTYSVSHDLRAPLRGIAGFSQALLEDCAGSLDRQASQYLGRIIAASKRMGELIDELLLLSRVTRGEIRPRRISLSGMFSAAINRLRQENPEIKAEVTIEPELYCQGDRALMETVVDNLASNAWKFTGRNDIARVDFGCLTIDGERVFFVRDNGAGFDEEYASKLFEPFQRLHSQSEFEGHGVGLASVQRIISRHGGRVWAEGKVDQGATFFFSVNPVREGGTSEGEADSAG